MASAAHSRACTSIEQEGGAVANIEPLRRENLEEFEGLFRAIESLDGSVVNSFLTLGRRPEILRAFVNFARAVMGAGTVDSGLKQLVAQVASTSAGCRYCQSHTATSAVGRGISEEKIQALYDFEQSSLFDEAERAALRLARDAALVPNATNPTHFEELRTYYTDEQITELVAAIGLFGFLNRWNDTIATELEDEPFTFASHHLKNAGWEAGKHRS